MRNAIVAALLVTSPAPALAQTADVAGKLGYLSEWELTAKVTQHVSAGTKEFAGPLTVRHVGVCTVGRPVEMTGEIRYRLTGWMSRQVQATLVIDGTACGFEAKLSGAYDGVLDCPQWRGVPLSLSIRSTE